MCSYQFASQGTKFSLYFKSLFQLFAQIVLWVHFYPWEGRNYGGFSGRCVMLIMVRVILGYMIHAGKLLRESLHPVGSKTPVDRLVGAFCLGWSEGHGLGGYARKLLIIFSQMLCIWPAPRARL